MAMLGYPICREIWRPIAVASLDAPAEPLLDSDGNIVTDSDDNQLNVETDQ